MKRYILALMILPVYTIAQQKFSFTEFKYTTIPADETIDQDKYHEQACVVTIIWREFCNMGIKRLDRLKRIKEYLYEINTPESIRLYADIEEMMK